MANYINNKDLHKEMMIYINQVNINREKGIPDPPLTNYIGEAIMMIANKLANKSNFAGYSFKEDMIGDGIENCVLYLHNYKPPVPTEKNPNVYPNPFAYITQIIKFAYIRRIQKESKQHYIKVKNMENYMLYDLYIENDKIDNQITQDFIKKFEETNIKKKKNKKSIEKFYSENENE